MNPKDFFDNGEDDDEEPKDVDLTSFGFDDIMNFGLKPGASSHKRAAGKPPEWNPLKGGTLEDLEQQDDEALEKEIEGMMAAFEEDPIAATRKQLVRMATIEWKYLQGLYKELAKDGLKEGRAKALRIEINSSTGNLLTLQGALKALPSQRKDDGGANNVASLAEQLDAKKKEIEKAGSDPNDFTNYIQAQRERIRKEETGN